MKTLNNYFEKIYCINLDSRPDRYGESLQEFQKIGIDVQRVSGVLGSDVFKSGLNRSAGAYGVFLTHVKILKEAMRNNYENILILEDDVVFIDGFNEIFNQRITALPDDWDLLYVGGNNIFGKDEFILVDGDVDYEINHDTYKQLDHRLCKTKWTQCAHALGINGKAYQTLMVGMERFSHKPIDRVHRLLQRRNEVNAYVFMPSLALQRSGYSDIENRYVDYDANEGIYF